jgi:hypothetical protein
MHLAVIILKQETDSRNKTYEKKMFLAVRSKELLYKLLHPSKKQPAQQPDVVDVGDEQQQQSVLKASISYEIDGGL